MDSNNTEPKKPKRTTKKKGLRFNNSYKLVTSFDGVSDSYFEFNKLRLLFSLDLFILLVRGRIKAGNFPTEEETTIEYPFSHHLKKDAVINPKYIQYLTPIPKKKDFTTDYLLELIESTAGNKYRYLFNKCRITLEGIDNIDLQEFYELYRTSMAFDYVFKIFNDFNNVIKYYQYKSKELFNLDPEIIPNIPVITSKALEEYNFNEFAGLFEKFHDNDLLNMDEFNKKWDAFTIDDNDSDEVSEDFSDLLLRDSNNEPLPTDDKTKSEGDLLLDEEYQKLLANRKIGLSVATLTQQCFNIINFYNLFALYKTVIELTKMDRTVVTSQGRGIRGFRGRNNQTINHTELSSRIIKGYLSGDPEDSDSKTFYFYKDPLNFKFGEVNINMDCWFNNSTIYGSEGDDDITGELGFSIDSSRD